MATSTSNWPIRKTQNQIILVPTPHTCVLRVLIENNSNLNVWKLSIADIPDKNKYILVPPPTHTTGDRGFSITNGQRNLETPDFVEKIRIFGKYPNRIWTNFSIKIDQIWELLIQLKNQDFWLVSGPNSNRFGHSPGVNVGHCRPHGWQALPYRCNCSHIS